MYKLLNLDTWNRNEHFHFFKDYDNPFYNICTEVDVTVLYNLCKEKGFSFFFASLFASTKAANLTEEFRYRIKDGKVIVYDLIHPGSTFLNEDNTFRFVYFNFNYSFQKFNAEAEKIIKNISTGKNKTMLVHEEQDNLIHYSVIPWISFSSISHARNFKTNDSIPKIVFGKHSAKSGRLVMPVSVEVHHALVDGFHVANYLNKFQEILNRPAAHLDAGA